MLNSPALLESYLLFIDCKASDETSAGSITLQSKPYIQLKNQKTNQYDK